MSENPDSPLKRFSRDHSESAFRELVRQHSPLVHGSALRLLGGDRAAAQDVTQEVFTLLARKANGLDESALSGWLYRQACRRASNHRRSEVRRKQRELVSAQAMTHSESGGGNLQAITHEIDEALLALPSAERNALVLRYFEDRDFRSVGGLLGVSEEAARKRVNRALERLVGLLRMRGVSVATASLGSTMTGMAGAPLRPDLVLLISMRSIESLSTTASTSILSILKPFVCGVILTSLIAAATLFVWRGLDPSRQADLEVRGTGTASQAPSARDKAAASQLDLISQIKRIKAGPDHAMTALRLSALLDSIAIADVPAFIAAANTRLTLAEQNACYLPLFKRWLAEDPHAAMAFAFEFDVGLAPPGFDSTNMLRSLLHVWMDRDMGGMRAWLSDQWDHRSMKTTVFGDQLRAYFAVTITDVLLRDHSAALAFDYIRSLPDRQTARKCLTAMTGQCVYASAYMNIGPERIFELYRELSRWPDAVFATSLKIDLCKRLNETEPEYAESVLASMNPRERFEATLYRIGTYSKQVSRVKTPEGESMSYETVDNREQGEADSMKAGLEAGLPRREILQQIGTAIILKGDSIGALEWLDRHRGEFDADPLLLEKIGSMQKDGAPPPGRSPSESGIIRWASRLENPGQRLALCRAGFQLLLAESPQAAEQYLAKNTDLPEDLQSELRNMMSPAAP